MGKITANIRDHYGRTFIKHVDGEYFTSKELVRLIEDLKGLVREMTETGLSQPEIQLNLHTASVLSVVHAAVLHYPFYHEYLYWTPSAKNRGLSEPRFCGVYFLTHPEMPKSIKIGCSTDIYQRTKALYYQLGKRHVRVLGYMETDLPYVVEEYLHEKFQAVRIRDEWFDYNAVIEWLKAGGDVG